MIAKATKKLSMKKFRKQVNVRFSVVEWDKILVHAQRLNIGHATFIRQCIDSLLLRGKALPLNSIIEYQIYGVRMEAKQYDKLHQMKDDFGQSISWLVRSEVLNTIATIQSLPLPVKGVSAKAKTDGRTKEGKKSNALHCLNCKKQSVWPQESRNRMFCTNCGATFRENIYA
jgi:hypothetical protein